MTVIKDNLITSKEGDENEKKVVWVAMLLFDSDFSL